MKARIQRRDLKAALARLKPTVGSRASLPALACARLEVERGRLTLATADLEARTTVVVRGAGIDDGAAMVAHKTLARLVARLDGGPVELTSDGPKTVTVASGDAHVTLTSDHDPDEFPLAPPAPAGARDDLTGMLGHFPALTAAAAGTDRRAALTGVLFEPGALVATDSYRMVAVPLPPGHTMAGIVTARILPSLTRARPARLVGATTDTHAHFWAPGDDMTVHWVVRLIDAQFPDWRRLIPDDWAGTCTVDPARAGKVVARLATLAEPVSGSIPPVVLTPDRDTGAVTLAMTGREGDTAAETVPADLAGDVPGEWAFNPHYFADALGALGDGPVTLHLRDALKPVVLRSAAAPEVRILLVPVRL